MIRDEDLKSSVDYSEGQKEAAHRILVELVNIFGEYAEDIRIVGGWVPYLVMKTAAMGRGKAKDAYDIYFLIKHYRGGVKELAKEFQSNAGNKLVQEMKEKLAGKFASPDHVGPKDIVDFLGLADEDEIEMTKRDAYEQMQALLRLISV